MTTRAQAAQIVVDYVLADFDVTVGDSAPAEMREQISAGIGASATLAVDALQMAGLLSLAPE